MGVRAIRSAHVGRLASIWVPGGTLSIYFENFISLQRIPKCHISIFGLWEILFDILGFVELFGSKPQILISYTQVSQTYCAIYQWKALEEYFPMNTSKHTLD